MKKIFNFCDGVTVTIEGGESPNGCIPPVHLVGDYYIGLVSGRQAEEDSITDIVDVILCDKDGNEFGDGTAILSISENGVNLYKHIDSRYCPFPLTVTRKAVII